MIAKDLSLRATALLLIALGVIILAGLAMGVLRPSLLTVVFQRTLDLTCNVGPAGYLAFVALTTIIAVSGVLPASLLGIAAGAAYGLPLGFLLAAVGTMAGAIVAFALSRSLFRDAVARQLARRSNSLVSTACLRAAAGASFASCAFRQSCLSPRQVTLLACLQWGPRRI